MPEHPPRPLPTPERDDDARTPLAPGASPEAFLARLERLAARLLSVPSARAVLLDDAPASPDGVDGSGGPDGAAAAPPGGPAAVVARLGEPLAVADARADVRLRGLDEVAAGGLRAYLGVPLRGPGGRVVGGLCVYDARGRAWAPDDVAALADLAAAAVAELELSALAVDYAADRVRWRLAVTAGGVGSFDWDLRTGTLLWDDQLHALFGLEPGTFGGTIEAFSACLHPDDRPRVQAALQEAVDGVTRYAAEYRAVHPDGTVRWVKAQGLTLPGPDGTAERVLGAAYDTTAERDADARIARVLETMSTAFFLLDDAWRFTYVNAEAERLLGRSRAELLGEVVWDVFPSALGSLFEQHYRGAVAAGEPRSFEAYYPPPLDAWYDVRAFPGPDGLSVYFHDVTGRRRAEEQRVLARTAADAATRRLAVLATVSDDLSSTLDTEYAVGRLARHLVRELGSWCLVTLWDEEHRLRDIAGWHAEPHLRPAVARYARVRLGALAPGSYLHRALRSGELVVVPDATERISVLLSGEARDVLRSLAPRAAYAVPMRARGRTVGAITLFLDDDQPDLTDDDVALLVQLADRAGVALDNAQLYQGQRRMAETLQRALLTAPAQPPDVDLAVRYVPAAAAAQVGGDWYDAFVQPDGSTVLVIGDVMGHDRHAAAAMSQVRTLLRGIGATTGGTPAQMLAALDTTMERLRVDAMASAVVLRVEQTAGDRAAGRTTLRWTNAGHLPPLLVAPDGTVRELRTEPELVLGVTADVTRTDGEVTVPRGSTVLLFTDGLVERRGEQLQDGLDRLAELVARLVPEARRRAGDHAVLDAAYLADAVLSRGTAGDAPDDDIALLVAHLALQGGTHEGEGPGPEVDGGPRTDV
ncbi:SpoIIE family protein phosphatase [Cellulomonas sp. C5510]|uniref:SpoIIE family protein phosphatase n=1 Tax=Cellulomonas sp. C5510 TaxID=2871170 RepID=UPI001C9423A9|nr:SpoIIE family protein phosphatase [Cellulomonas sp. C5510]QZN86965.1 SpoIIE family protein phosphatase [Cellulomonas sp. C5510]